MMNTILLAVSFFGIGLLVFLAGPLLISPSLSRERRTKLANWYFEQSMAGYRRATLVKRKLAGYDLVPTSFNGERRREKVSVDGETHYIDDPLDYMSRLCKKPFGIVKEGRPIFVHPELAEAGEAIKARDERGDREIQLEEERKPRFNRHALIPDGIRLVDWSKLSTVLTGDGNSQDADKVDEYVEKSQAGYKSRDVLATMTFLIAYAAGGGMAWFIWSNTGSSNESTVTVPMMIMFDVAGVLV